MTTKKLTKEERDKLFPYETFPIRFVYPLGNGKEQVVAHFQCQDHVDKYIVRHNMKPSDYEISYRDESLRPEPKRKRKPRPKPTAAQANHADVPKSETSTTRTRKRTGKTTAKTTPQKRTRRTKKA